MVKRLRYGTENTVSNFEVAQMNRLNEVFGAIDLTEEEERTLLWLAGWDESTVSNIVAMIRKTIVAAQDKTVKTQMAQQQDQSMKQSK